MNGMNVKYRRELNKVIDLSLPVAELGVAEGLFSRDMLNWDIPKLYSVDAWSKLNQKGDGGFDQSWHDKNYNNAKKLLSQFGDRSVILKGLTHEMASQVEDNSLGLLYLDGDHSFEGVMRDLNAWYPKVAKGGYVAGHDYLCADYDVQRAVRKFASENNIHEILTIEENSIQDAGFIFMKPL